jgi:hypothetical protein
MARTNPIPLRAITLHSNAITLPSNSDSIMSSARRSLARKALNTGHNHLHPFDSDESKVRLRLKGTLLDHCGLRLISFDEARKFFAVFVK